MPYLQTMCSSSVLHTRRPHLSQQSSQTHCCYTVIETGNITLSTLTVLLSTQGISELCQWFGLEHVFSPGQTMQKHSTVKSIYRAYTTSSFTRVSATHSWQTCLVLNTGLKLEDAGVFFGSFWRLYELSSPMPVKLREFAKSNRFFQWPMTLLKFTKCQQLP